MEDKNQLNDIVLNKKGGSGSGKKIMLAAAVLMIILIIVIVIMNTFSSSSKNNLETGVKTAQLPKPPVTDMKQDESQDQLFKPVTVIHENNTSGTLDKIAQKLKAQSMTHEDSTAPTTTATVQIPQPTPQPVAKPVQESIKPIAKVKPAIKSKPVVKHVYTSSKKRYIQVAAFTRFKPNKKFLASIKKHGYSYEYKKVTIKGRPFTKVLIGPFASESLAREALATVRKDINPQAFITSK